MKYSNLIIASLLAFMLSSTGCTVNSATVSNVVSNAETALGQTAAYESARATVAKWTSYIGLTPTQAEQMIPVLQDYYTQVAGALKNTSGATTTQKLGALKDTLVAKLKTSLTAQQISKAISYL